MLNIKDSNYFKRSIKIYLITAIVFILTFILAIIFSPSYETFKSLGGSSHKGISEAYGLNKLWQYIINNGFRVPLQMFIISLLPIPFLYYVNLLSTTIMTGIAFGFVVHFDLYKGSTMVISSFPHSIIEILAMCFVISGLYKLNKSIIRKITNIFRNNNKPNLSFKIAITNLLKVYILIALPLYIISAFMETYLTHFIYNLLN